MRMREWHRSGDDEDDVHVVTQSTRGKNAHCEKVTAHMGVAAENVG